MGIALSLLLVAAGAILTWAVSADASGIDIQVVGVILMIMGLVGLLLTLLFWQSWWGRGAIRRTAYADEYAPAPRRRANYRGRRRTVVEEDEVPPPDAPY